MKKWLRVLSLAIPAVSFAQVRPTLTASEYNDQVNPLGANLVWTSTLPIGSTGHYGIYRVLSLVGRHRCPKFGTSWKEFVDVPPTQLNYVDFTQLPTDKDGVRRGYWCYAVTATDSNGNESLPSNFAPVWMGAAGYVILDPKAADCITHVRFASTADASATMTLLRQGQTVNIPLYMITRPGDVEFYFSSYQYHDNDVVVASVTWPDGDKQSVQLFAPYGDVPPIRAFYESVVLQKIPVAGGNPCSSYRIDEYQRVTE